MNAWRDMTRVRSVTKPAGPVDGLWGLVSGDSHLAAELADKMVLGTNAGRISIKAKS